MSHLALHPLRPLYFFCSSRKWPESKPYFMHPPLTLEAEIFCSPREQQELLAQQKQKPSHALPRSVQLMGWLENQPYMLYMVMDDVLLNDVFLEQ